MIPLGRLIDPSPTPPWDALHPQYGAGHVYSQESRREFPAALPSAPTAHRCSRHARHTHPRRRHRCRRCLSLGVRGLGTPRRHRPRVPRLHPRPPRSRGVVTTVRCHHRGPGSQRGVWPRALPHTRGSGLRHRHDLTGVHPADQGTPQNGSPRLPVDPASAHARPVAARVPARRRHADAAVVRAATCQPCATLRPTHPTHAEGGSN